MRINNRCVVNVGVFGNANARLLYSDRLCGARQIYAGAVLNAPQAWKQRVKQ